jgi:hypothetical protein
MKIFLLSTLLILTAVRIALPSLVLKKINEKGQTMNTVYTLHAEDLTLSLVTATFTLHKPALTLRSAPEKFMTADAIVMKVDLVRSVLKNFSYREWEIKNWIMTITPAVRAAYLHPKYKRPHTMTIGKVIAKNATLNLEIEKGKKMTIPVSGSFAHLSPDALADYDFHSDSKLAQINVRGEFDPNVRPMNWDINLIVKHFDLTQLNHFLADKMPVKIKTGYMDLYFEGESHQKHIQGYIKPFIDEVQVEKSKKKMNVKSPLMMGLAGSFITYFLAGKKHDSLGVRIPFHYSHENFKLDSNFSLEKALDEMTKYPPTRKIENIYRL